LKPDTGLSEAVDGVCGAVWRAWCGLELSIAATMGTAENEDESPALVCSSSGEEHGVVRCGLGGAETPTVLWSVAAQ
jgi:hypothetical protein